VRPAVRRSAGLSAGAMTDAAEPDAFHAAPAAETLVRRISTVLPTTARKSDEPGHAAAGIATWTRPSGRHRDANHASFENLAAPHELR
jgi:hypothetical protein